MTTDNKLRIGIDIGGTFTDFVIFNSNSGSLLSFKRLSTPDNPAEAVLEGLANLLSNASNPSGSDNAENTYLQVQIIHGSTVATNALLERKGARTALVTTQGFRDVLQIGRQNRPALYDLEIDPPPPLVPEQLRFEAKERIDHSGQVIRALQIEDLDAVVSQVNAARVESVAICLIFSFISPNHEKQLADRLRNAGYPVSCSHEVIPEYREYERTSTTVVNAYVSPILEKYLSHLESKLSNFNRSNTIRIMQSNGGNISLDEARKFGVRCILSGPAGGVIGARYIAQQAFSMTLGEIQAITFDMGGTSTDVSLIHGNPRLTTEVSIGGCPIGIPVLDIHTIGAGGGSIARIDSGGAFRVGPQSAGAIPGPACYARSDLENAFPTVTDANLILGRLDPDYFLGGQMHLDTIRAHHVLTRLGKNIGLDPIEAALGVIEVVNTHMERALRLVSIERGHDPRDFALISFGGAGGLHASELARRLGISRVIIPPQAATLSALGMLAADVVKDYSLTVMLPGDIQEKELKAALSPIVARGYQDILAEGIQEPEIIIDQYLDMRYQGQSFELTIPFSKDFLASFHNAHNEAYGFHDPKRPVEIVNIRVRAVGKTQQLPIKQYPKSRSDPSQAMIGSRQVYYPFGSVDVPLFDAKLLLPGNRIPGPARIIRTDTTIVAGPGDIIEIDSFLNLVITLD